MSLSPPPAADPAFRHRRRSWSSFVTRNKTAIEFLKNGELYSAQREFSQALREAQILEIDGTSTAATAPQEGQQEPAVPPVVPPVVTSVVAASEDDTHSEDDDDDGDDELLSRLRVLPSDDNLEEQAISIEFLLNNDCSRILFPDDGGNASMIVSLAFAVIIYNTGLLFHIKGLSTNDEVGCASRNNLTKAVHLYEKSIQLLRVFGFHTASTVQGTRRHPIPDLLYMTLLKHMADIHARCGYSDYDNTYGRELASFILTTNVGQYDYCNAISTNLMRNQVGSFFVYAMSLERSHRYAPAA